MVDVPTLTDGTVTLRAHRDDDVPGLVEQYADALTREWTAVPLEFGIDDAKRFVRELWPGGWATDREWSFAIEADGKYAGTVNLRNHEFGRAEIAYAAHPSARGTGSMLRSLRLLVDWVFAERDVQTLQWCALRGNWASRRLAWRLGFTFDGTVRRWLPERDGLGDTWVGTLLREEPREPRGTWLEVPVLTGSSVLLRPLRETDVTRIVEACTDERTSYWLGRMPVPYTAADAAAWLETTIEGAAAGTKVTWALADPTTDVLLGAINIFDLTLGAEGEVGYWAHPAARGRGVMTEATGLVVRYAFETLELRIVRAVAAVDNAASRRVIEANGFRFSGFERMGTQTREGYADAARYDLTREEFTGS